MSIPFYRRLRLLGACAALALPIGILGCHRAPSSSSSGAAAAPAALFTDVTAASRVAFQHHNGQGYSVNIMNTTGSGCGVIDYDNDGWLDLFLINGDGDPKDGCHLYHNNHDGTFTDVTAQAGVAGLGHGFGMGCAVGDYDGDGYQDLFVAYYGKSVLYRNRGNGTFEDVTAASGLKADGFCTAAAFADLDGDGHPDLYVARYVYFDKNSKQHCESNGAPGSCPPYVYTPQPHLVYQNDGHGHFRDVTKAWGFTDKDGRGLGVSVLDYDQDGKPDLFVANDGSANFLYHNEGGGKFKNVAHRLGIAADDTGHNMSNMGCDFADMFGDGSLVGTTGVFQNEAHPLWKYTPETGFLVVSNQTGFRNLTFRVLTFGIGFGDLDNDGWNDIFLANGHVQDHIQQSDKNCTYAQSRSYLHNTGHGTLEDWSAKGGTAVTAPAVGRGLAFADLDNDGDLDLVVSNNNGPAMVLRNDHPKRHWLSLRLIGKGPNWEAEGARVEVTAGGRTQRGYVHTSYSFASANDPRVHFGLGDTAAVERVVVHWPDGKQSEHANVPVDKITTLVEDGANPPAPLKPLLTGK